MHELKNFSNQGVQARVSKMLSRYNWIIAEPYYDVVVDNGSTGKTKTFITLRQFKERIDKRQSLKQMKAEGVSKHLLNFFSNFLQGKIKLTKAVFEDRYNLGKELEEISIEFQIDRGDVSYLRQLYGIKRKGATFINRKKTEENITQIQKDVIYGSLMGDAKRMHTKWNSSVSFGHSNKQKDYVEWKYLMLKNLVTKRGIKMESQFDERYDKKYFSYGFYTFANSDVEKIINKFYGENGKQVNIDILNNLSELSIAVWFMDDGYSDKGKYGVSNLVFCTESFSKESCENIIQWFKEKWNISSHLRERQLKNGVGYRVVIKSESVDKLLDLIEPHLIPSMRYKIGL